MNRHTPQSCDLVFRGDILEDYQKLSEAKLNNNDHCILLYQLDSILPAIIKTQPPVSPPKPVEEPVSADHPEIELSEQQQISGEDEIEEDDEDEEYNGNGEDPSLESLVALLQGIQPDIEVQVPINQPIPVNSENQSRNTVQNGEVPANNNDPAMASHPPVNPLPTPIIITGQANDPGSAQAFRIPFSQILRIIPVPEQDLQTLMSMGFPEWRCRKALLLNIFNADMALEWLLNQSNNPQADDPFTEEEAASIIGALHNIQPEDTDNIEEQIAECVKNNKCTFVVTKKKFAPQKWYYCYSCGLVDSEGVCESCAAVCHKNHKLSAVRSSKKFYCDCGAGAYDCKCNKE